MPPAVIWVANPTGFFPDLERDMIHHKRADDELEGRGIFRVESSRILGW
jgi:hypothetical protein